MLFYLPIIDVVFVPLNEGGVRDPDAYILLYRPFLHCYALYSIDPFYIATRRMIHYASWRFQFLMDGCIFQGFLAPTSGLYNNECLVE